MTITLNKTVKQLQDEFTQETGLFLRVYKGNNTVEDGDITLENLKATEGAVEFSNRMKIGTIEEKFKTLNIKVQIASSDNSKLCNDDFTLAKAIKKYSIDKKNPSETIQGLDDMLGVNGDDLVSDIMSDLMGELMDSVDNNINATLSKRIDELYANTPLNTQELVDILNDIESSKEELEQSDYQGLNKKLYEIAVRAVSSHDSLLKVISMTYAITFYSKEEMDLEDNLWNTMKVVCYKILETNFEEINPDIHTNGLRIGKVQAIAAFRAEGDAPMYRFWLKELGFKDMFSEDLEKVAVSLMGMYYVILLYGDEDTKEKYFEDLSAVCSDQFEVMSEEELLMAVKYPDDDLISSIKELAEKTIDNKAVQSQQDEINDGSSSGDIVDKESLIKELKAFIETADEDDKEYINGLLDDEDYLYIVTNYNANSELQKKVFKYLENIELSVYDYRNLAEAYIEKLEDKENSKRIISIAIKKLESIREALSLAQFIADEDYLDDKEFAEDVCKNALSLVEDNDDLISLADGVCQYTNNKEWGIELFKKAYSQSEDSWDFKTIAYGVCEYSDDKEWAREIFTKAYEACDDLDDIRSLAEDIMNIDYLNDKEWARELLHEVELKSETFDQKIDLLSSVIELDDTNWRNKLIHSLKPLCETFDNYDQLIQKCERDNELQKELVSKAILVLEDEDEKESLVRTIDWYMEDSKLSQEIEDSSIEELKEKYNKPSKSEDENSHKLEVVDSGEKETKIVDDNFEWDKLSLYSEVKIAKNINLNILYEHRDELREFLASGKKINWEIKNPEYEGDIGGSLYCDIEYGSSETNCREFDEKRATIELFETIDALLDFFDDPDSFIEDNFDREDYIFRKIEEDIYQCCEEVEDTFVTIKKAYLSWDDVNPIYPTEREGNCFNIYYDFGLDYYHVEKTESRGGKGGDYNFQLLSETGREELIGSLNEFYSKAEKSFGDIKRLYLSTFNDEFEDSFISFEELISDAEKLNYFVTSYNERTLLLFEISNADTVSSLLLDFSENLDSYFNGFYKDGGSWGTQGFEKGEYESGYYSQDWIIDAFGDRFITTAYEIASSGKINDNKPS